MAYCLRSFVETLEQVLHPYQHHKNWVLHPDHKPQIQSLFENATFLQDFLDEASPQIQEKISSLEDQIMEAAQKAKETLESYITDQILSNPEGQSFTISPPDLREALQVFEVAKEEVIKVKAAAGQGSDDTVMSHPVSLPFYPDSRNKKVIGLDSDVHQLKDRLLGRSSKLDIIPIVGMGGIGKTTLARKVYDDYSCRKHFDCFGWVTVSQNYDRNKTLETLISSVTGKLPEHIYHLIETLHKTLSNKRYLIVIDDIWSCEVWDNIRNTFPDGNLGSRIIVTTRENSVAYYLSFYRHEMHLLDEDDSRKLLRAKVFGEKPCPLELEEVGKRIAMNCQGLPLAIQIIGEFLSKSQMSVYTWEYVAHNESTILAKFDDNFSGIFSRSFTHLPHYLKPCLLYMSTFSDDHDIGASKIIKLWVAEGFLKPIGNKSLEEAAEIYLNALADSNLIFVLRRKKNGKAKSYGICNFLRDLCLRKAQEKKFLYVKDSQTDILQDDKLCLRLVSGHSPIDDPDGSTTQRLASLTHSYLLIGNSKKYKLGHCMCFKPSLLRVLDVYQVKVNEFPEVFLQLVNLRYLAIYTKPGEIPRSIYVLTNLQTLIVKYLTSSIALVLALPKLRHFELDDLIRTSESRHDTFIGPHESLQSLYNIPLEILAENLLGKLPKLRKLGIKCGYYNDNVDLTCFQELETLKVYNGFYLANGNFISNISFPSSLKKLTLYSCGVPESLLDAVAVFPNLEVLKLKACIFRLPDWVPFEDGFHRLKYLEISCVRNLKELRAESEHFPCLEHLVLRNCPYLREIPDDIGNISTLIMIEVDECNASVFDSAMRMREEQQSYGNEELQFRLGSVIE